VVAVRPSWGLLPLAVVRLVVILTQLLLRYLLHIPMLLEPPGLPVRLALGQT
jgi:hypothetical protein